jgi:nucleotide-binding universal stress UspA family protein
MFKHFPIPADGSPATRRAAQAGIALARRLGAGARAVARKRVEAIGRMAKLADATMPVVVYH